jgi:hypothetical protein
MEIDIKDLKVLSSLIVKNLLCKCRLDVDKSRKEPCFCSWAEVEDWFEDICDLDLKVYKKEIEDYYRLLYGIETRISELFKQQRERKE